MPAGPIGSVWATASWPDTTWEAFSWDDAAPITIPAELEDLTTLWCQVWQPSIHALTAARSDDTGQLAQDVANVVGYDGETDLNTALAKYIEAEF